VHQPASRCHGNRISDALTCNAARADQHTGTARRTDTPTDRQTDGQSDAFVCTAAAVRVVASLSSSRCYSSLVADAAAPLIIIIIIIISSSSSSRLPDHIAVYNIASRPTISVQNSAISFSKTSRRHASKSCSKNPVGKIASTYCTLR